MTQETASPLALAFPSLGHPLDSAAGAVLSAAPVSEPESCPLVCPTVAKALLRLTVTCPEASFLLEHDGFALWS